MTTTSKENFDFMTIKSYEDACAKEGMDPNAQPDVSAIDEDLKKPILAAFKLMIIYRAINNGWRPDWGNRSQYKYFPWFEVLSSGFGFSFSYFGRWLTSATCGSRLCTDSSEKARYIAEQFEDLYKDFFLYSE